MANSSTGGQDGLYGEFFTVNINTNVGKYTIQYEQKTSKKQANQINRERTCLQIANWCRSYLAAFDGVKEASYAAGHRLIDKSRRVIAMHRNMAHRR